jgi:archaellum component FlaC
MEDLQSQTNTNSILKELSDIKSSLSVNTNETQNIKSNISEIKTDIKEIKSDFINRREFKEAIDDIHEQISPLKKVMYSIMATIGIAIIGALLKLILK